MNFDKILFHISVLLVSLVSSGVQAEWVSLDNNADVTTTNARYDRLNRNFYSYTKVHNKSAEQIVGPLRAVVLNTNLPVTAPDGTTEDGLAYVSFSAQRIAPHKKAGVKINFNFERKRLNYTVAVQRWIEPETVSYDLVVPNATSETISLFAAMKTTPPDQIMFGHQHETTQGITISDFSGNESDTLNSVGDFSSVVGWDTLSIIKRQDQNGNWKAPEGYIDDHVRAAYERGSIVTISGHFDNKSYPVDGGQNGSSWDNRPSVEHVLPGGKDHEAYKADLNQLADWLNAMTISEQDPTLIPIVLRLLHENTGSWFWWGKEQTTPSQYKNLFRFTVEYLRDVKNVRNVLIQYSPNEDAGVNEQAYLERYPGDEYVDILGFDSYGSIPNDNVWLSKVVTAAATVSKMANARGKISAIAEVGLSSATIGNGDLDTNWYESLLNALTADSDAMGVSYMLVWRNGSIKHFWVPYVGPYNNGESAESASKLGDSLIDFLAFYADPRTLFNDDISGVYQHENVVSATETPYAYIMSPTRFVPLAADNSIIVSVGFDQPSSVMFTVAGQSIELLQDIENQYYTGALDTSTFVEDSVIEGEMATTLSNNEVITQSVTFLFDEVQALPKIGLVDDFEGYYGVDELLINNYSYTTGDPVSISLDPSNKYNGNYALAYEYSLTTKGWTGVKHTIDASDSVVDWSGFNTFSFWIDPDQLSQRLVIQLTTANGSWEAYKILGADATATTADVNALHGDDTQIEQLLAPTLVEVPLSAFIRPAWDSNGGVLDASEIREVNFFINSLASDAAPEAPINVEQSTLYIDDIRAIYLAGNGDNSDTPPLEFDFEYHPQGWQGQIDWSGSETLTSSSVWSQQGGSSLQGVVDLSTVNSAYVMQVFDDYDVTNFDSLSLYVSTIDAGENVTAKLFVKDGNWNWHDSGSVELVTGGNLLTIDLSELSGLKTVGVLFESFDNTSRSAEFYVDTVRPHIAAAPDFDPILYDFETELSNWQGQINWNGSVAAALSTNWSAEGNSSAQTVVDLSTGVNAYVMQVFSDIDTSELGTISVTVNSLNAGVNVKAKLFIKDESWAWHDSGAYKVNVDGTKLTIDVSQIASIKSIGVQFIGFDTSQTAAEFYVDQVLAELKETLLTDFETDTENWNGQVNWSDAVPATLSTRWSSNGARSAMTVVDLSAGVNAYVMQVFNDIDTSAMTTLSVNVHSKFAGENVTTKLFIKDSSWNWHDSGAVSLSQDGTKLSIDVSNFELIRSIGVQFQGYDTSSTSAEFYVDQVSYR